MFLYRPDHPKVLELFKLFKGSLDMCISIFFQLPIQWKVQYKHNWTYIAGIMLTSFPRQKCN